MPLDELGDLGMAGSTNSGVRYFAMEAGSSVPPGTGAAPAVEVRKAAGTNNAAPASAPAPSTCRRVTMGAPFLGVDGGPRHGCA